MGFLAIIALGFLVLVVIPLTFIEGLGVLRIDAPTRANRLRKCLSANIVSAIAWSLLVWLILMGMRQFMPTAGSHIISTFVISATISGIVIAILKLNAYKIIASKSTTKAPGSKAFSILVVLLNVVLPICALPITIAGTQIGAIVLERNRQNLEPLKFNSNEWIATKDGDDYWSAKRQRMLNDLIARHKLKGMTTDEVIELLGREGGDPSSGILTYKLGPFGLDSFWLTLYFTDNRVTRYEIWND